MAFTAVTYTFANSTTSDASQVNQNFTDIINGLSDGTKDISVNAGTFAGNVSISGNSTLGGASSDDVTVTGSLASTINIKTTNSYNIGSSTLGLAGIYFGANSQTVRVVGSGSMSATWTLTLPVSAGTDDYVLKTNGSGVTSWREIKAPTCQIFTSTGAADYTTPSGVKYLMIQVVGGGGGGAGSGTSGYAGGAAGTTGTDSTFKVDGGAAIITGAGGAGAGGISTVKGGAGGSFTIGSPAVDMGSTAGGQGDGALLLGTADGFLLKGAQGGASIFGSGGSGGYGAAGDAGVCKGSGGAGGGYSNNTGGYAGCGGGAGGSAIAIISSPSAAYDIVVGAGGAGGTTGDPNGYNGAAGAPGIVIVREFYQ
jgi:hypothetical protein